MKGTIRNVQELSLAFLERLRTFCMVLFTVLHLYLKLLVMTHIYLIKAYKFKFKDSEQTTNVINLNSSALERGKADHIWFLISNLPSAYKTFKKPFF